MFEIKEGTIYSNTYRLFITSILLIITIGLISTSSTFAISSAQPSTIQNTQRAAYARKKLAEKGVDFSEGRFFESLQNGELANVELFLDAGMDANLTYAFSFASETHILLIAIFSGKPDVAKLLIERGANVNAVNNHGFTALMAAVEAKNTELINLLIKKGADINYKNQFGFNAINTAILSNNIAIVNLLLSKGATENLIPANTMVWSDLKRVSPEMIRLLVEKNIISATDADKLPKNANTAQNALPESIRKLEEQNHNNGKNLSTEQKPTTPNRPRKKKVIKNATQFIKA